MKDTLLIVVAIILAGAMIGGAVIYSNQKFADEDNDAFKGMSDAPVVIVEFSDFECPFCAAFYQNTLPKIEEEYIKTGKVKLVYRDFPLPFHLSAQKAAEAAECAYEQNRFWEMHNIIFENQDAIDVASLKQYAVGLGVNSSQFNSCLDSGKYADEVRNDYNYGGSIGISGTPTFFINGERLVGAQPYSVFKEIIDRKLAEVE